MMQYYADDCYACDVCSKEEEWYSYFARSTTFEMPFLHLFTNWNIFCISVKKKKTTFSRFVGSRHALLLQSLLFQNVLSHMFHSHFPSLT